MGEVYEAEQGSPRRRVALKVLKPWLSHNPDALRRFRREAQVPAELNHPGIVRIITIGATREGQAYYAMQLVRGVSLAQLIRQVHEPSVTPTAITGKAKTPTSDQAVSTPADRNGSETFEDELPGLARAYLQDRFRALAMIGAQAARALAFAHGEGHLHRDIKPSNLMVDFHDQVCLVDFGLTRALQGDALSTATGAVAGTPWYMSPEQAQGQPLDERSDLYSLGVTLFELATSGVGPYTSPRNNRAAVLAQIVAGMRLPLRTLAPDIPEALECIILKAMQGSAQRRYPNGLDLAADLEAFANAERVESTSWLPALSPEVKRRSKRLLLYSFAATLLVLGGWMLGGGLFQHGTGAKQDSSESNAPYMHRPLRTWLDLFSVTPPTPVLGKQLWGEGNWLPIRDYVELKSFNGITLLALDEDKQRRWFELLIDVDPLPFEDDPSKNRLGIFLGWRQNANDPASVPRFLLFELDERGVPGFPNGCWKLETALFAKNHQGKGSESLFPLPVPWSCAPAVGPPMWHNIRVRAFEDKLTIWANNVNQPENPQPVEIDLKKVRASHRFLTDIDARGAWGIWVRNGVGHFRNPKVMALSP